MLAKREYDDWSMSSERKYDTEAEQRFFENIENPKPATKELVELFREFACYKPNRS